MTTPLICSFCDTPSNQVDSVIVGQNGAVICEVCVVESFTKIVSDQVKRRIEQMDIHLKHAGMKRI